MLPLIRKYGLRLGLKVWSLRRRCHRPTFAPLILQQLHRRARHEDARRNPVAAELLRTIIRDITPPAPPLPTTPPRPAKSVR